MIRYLVFIGLLLGHISSAMAERRFLCAGGLPGTPLEDKGWAAKPTQMPSEGTRSAVVIFAQFADEEPVPIPEWAAYIFDPQKPGSFSHFYDIMSFGKLRVRGEIGPRRYVSRQPASAYLADSPYESGDFGQFVLEILEQADAEIDFSGFDSDGPDGIPSSGDDDGFVDALFVVMASVPANFLVGAATGVGYLGLDDERLQGERQIEDGAFISGDGGFAGRPIRIASTLGTVQREDGLSGTVGGMCHEYGHVLDLPDLYNTSFLQTEGNGPEEDSAGIGHWGLMGWGADGWHGDDGPASFCAWNRVRLGWAEVAEIGQGQEEVRLPSVGRRGQVFKVPLTGREYFLLEYRRRQDTYYDRNIPADGVLVWHVERRLPTPDNSSQTVLDLECADGRWVDAGYPLGSQPDGRHGSDNLDFWAHDPAYSEVHAGNLGDATDVFDGVRYSSFTPDSNPSAHSADGKLSVRIEDIRIDGEWVSARVQTTTLLIEVSGFSLVDLDGNGMAVSYEPVSVRPQLANVGGVNASDVRARLHTDDPFVELLQEEHGFGQLKIGRESFSPGLLSFRFTNGFTGTHTAALSLFIYANGTLVQMHDFTASGVSSRQTVSDITIIDAGGNGDGQLQAGEFVRLEVRLDAELPNLLEAFGFYLVPLDGKMRSIQGETLILDADAVLRSREYLASSALAAGDQAGFELRAASAHGTWSDTLWVPVGTGIDSTPPRLGMPRVRTVGHTVHFVLAERDILDGSAMGQVAAHLFPDADTTRAVMVPMEWRENRYEGEWQVDTAGTYGLWATAEDVHGNRGASSRQVFHMAEPGQTDGPGGTDGSVSTGSWEQIELPGSEVVPGIQHLAFAPDQPEVVYASGTEGSIRGGDDAGVWRSDDGGNTWTQLGLMISRPVLVDAANPLVIYVRGTPALMSTDGGITWEPRAATGVNLLAADPVIPGRLYGQRSESSALLVSHDAGFTWEELGSTVGGVLRVHPRDPQILVVGHPSYWTSNPHEQVIGAMQRSADGGRSWEELSLNRVFDAVHLDPHHLEGLYATASGELWYSADGGQSWEPRQDMPFASEAKLVPHPDEPDLIYAWPQLNGQKAWRTEDGGRSWQELMPPQYATVHGLIPLPLKADQLIGVMETFTERSILWQSLDRGSTWHPLAMPRAAGPTGTVQIDVQGNIYAGSAQDGPDSQGAGFYRSSDGGHSWNWHGGAAKNYYFGPFSRPVMRVLTLDPFEPGLAMLCRWGDLWRTVDGGSTWKEIHPMGGATFSYLAEIAVDTRQPGVYYFASLGVYRSADFGATWEKRSSGLPQIRFPYLKTVNGLAIDTDSGVLYAAIGDSIWLSVDEGQKWSFAGVVGSGSAYMALVAAPDASGVLFAAAPEALYRSSDRGRNWERLVRAVRVEPNSIPRVRFAPGDPQRVYYAAGPELLESRDGGISWRSLDDGLTGYPVFYDVAVDPFEPEMLYAATPWGLFRRDLRGLSTGVADEQATPGTFALRQNYPNPFNASTVIVYRISRTAKVDLTVYNIAGQRVKKLVNAVQDAGGYRIAWDGRNDAGRTLASGVYLCRLRAGEQVEMRKLLLLR